MGRDNSGTLNLRRVFRTKKAPRVIGLFLLLLRVQKLSYAVAVAVWSFRSSSVGRIGRKLNWNGNSKLKLPRTSDRFRRAQWDNSPDSLDQRRSSSFVGVLAGLSACFGTDPKSRIIFEP
jgi:hypothetical protein